MSNNSDAVDFSDLIETWGNNRQKVVQYAHMFLQSLEDSMRAMDVALELGDMEALKHHGHKSKSAARTMGAMKYGDLCEELEICGEDGVEKARNIVGQLHELLLRIAREVNKF